MLPPRQRTGSALRWRRRFMANAAPLRAKRLPAQSLGTSRRQKPTSFGELHRLFRSASPHPPAEVQSNPATVHPQSGWYYDSLLRRLRLYRRNGAAVQRGSTNSYDSASVLNDTSVFVLKCPIDSGSSAFRTRSGSPQQTIRCERWSISPTLSHALGRTEEEIEAQLSQKYEARLKDLADSLAASEARVAAADSRSRWVTTFASSQF